VVVSVSASERHVVSWNVQVERNYRPAYFLGGGRYDQAPANTTVQISVEFDHDGKAVDFEAAVRKMLEEA
jgi:hypothetical protein